jgi:large subunit ribosomal protein L24
MNKIRKGDKIVVLAGKDKGKQGTVQRVQDDGRVVVEGINLVKRHTRPNPNRGITGGIVDKEASLHASNVSLINPATGKAGRVGFKSLADGRKVRYFKKGGEVLDAK